MKKVILGGMLLGLMTGMCFAQRGGARPMGNMGRNVEMGPHVGGFPAARPVPNARPVGPNAVNRSVGPNAVNIGSNVGAGNHAKPGTGTPDVGPGPKARTVGPNVPLDENSHTVGPNTGVGPKARTIGSDIDTSSHVGPPPQ